MARAVKPIAYMVSKFLSEIRRFSTLVVSRPLRQYQVAPAYAILDSVLNQRGMSSAVVFSRQAGKNELSAQVEGYLLNLYQRKGGFVVKAGPTHKPQFINSKMRLEQVPDSDRNPGQARRRKGYTIFLDEAGCVFLSADPSSSVVGATASIMLECDEAKDVNEDKWEIDFTPMAASTNATRVFYGTVWTSKTMLAKLSRALLEQEQVDGQQRVFYVPWEDVAGEDEEMAGAELRGAEPRKDSTVATTFEVDPSTLKDPLLAAPSYKVVETDRFEMFRDDGSEDWSKFWTQVGECRYEVSEGEEKRMKWAVVDPTVHEDRIISAALVAELHKVKRAIPHKSTVIEARDVLDEIDSKEDS